MTKGFRICCPGGLPTDQVTVSFDANGGSGSMAPLSVGVGGSLVIPKIAFDGGGRGFVGWMTSLSGDVVFTDESTIPAVVADMTLYAKWALGKTITTVSASDGLLASSITVSWTAVAGATSYEVWRGSSSDASNASKIAATEFTFYTDSSAGHGAKYYYWIRAICADGVYDLSDSYDSGYRGLHAPTKISLSRGAYMSWTAVTGATSYEVGYATYFSGNWGNPDSGQTSFTIKTTTATSISISVSAERRFWVRARNSIAVSSWVCLGDEQ